MLALAQALLVLQLMPEIGVVPNGDQSWRVQFRWKGDVPKGPNRPTKEDAELDKARLEAAPDEDKPGIITAMKAEKKKINQEAEAQEKAEEAKKETEHLLSKIHVRQHTSGSYGVVFCHDDRHPTYGPLRSRSGETALAENESRERAEKDKQYFFGAAWDGMSALYCPRDA